MLELDRLEERFVCSGHGVREIDFFGAPGLAVIATGEWRWVCVTPRDEQWELRITPHGGPHWVLMVELSQVEAHVLRTLNAYAVPPSPEWVVDDE